MPVGHPWCSLSLSGGQGVHFQMGPAETAEGGAVSQWSLAGPRGWILPGGCSFVRPPFLLLQLSSLLGSVGRALLPKASLSLGARVGVGGAFLVWIRWLFPLRGFHRLSCVGGSKETRGHTEVSFPMSRGPSSHLSESSCVYCNVQALGSQGRGPRGIGTTPRGGTRVWSLTP